ncbi:light-harvesting complex-like protein 3 isotype 1, chloroplastic [Ziziphus jujuba]|uniref:Light-harvesting complex-like protein 3 isotype 1, chloroplastic n=1 Tax=Ziziphus jujuba TaxID=326968 RepID=A0ABM4AH01_ZIZJJ|nr:light-harvesting complex-like protein 3 isotype 1, chloroplastic [Ziziphus jujuba]
MASIAISASLQTLSTSNNLVIIRKHPQSIVVRSLGTKQATHVVNLDVESQTNFKTAEQDKSAIEIDRHDEAAENRSKPNSEIELSGAKFTDERWKKGTWDLNMFVKNGKIDWDSVIVAGRAAMVGFFMAYIIDALTGLDVVGQSGNFICKAGLFVTVTGIILFKKTQDFDNLKKLADEATLYYKQWQSSWQDQDSGTGRSNQTGHKI